MFYEMSVMEFWHINSLDEWQAKSEDERALLIGYYNTKNRMMDYENYLDEIKRN